MAIYGLERFVEYDQVDVPIVPNTTSQKSPAIAQMNNTDILTDIIFDCYFNGTFNAYTSTLLESNMFPYSFIQNLLVPYQSNAVAATNQNAFLQSVIGAMRASNRRVAKSNVYAQQAPVSHNAYNYQSSPWFTPTSTPTPSGSIVAPFRLQIPVSLYFEKFYDLTSKGQMGAVDDIFVSPLFMSAMGRNITPKMTLNPVIGTEGDGCVFTQSGTLTTPATWTDNGSYCNVIRQGWRQPAGQQELPVTFNWAYNTFLDQQAVSTKTITYIPEVKGQLLSIVAVVWDPTINNGQGGFMDLSNVKDAALTYGSGINKYQDRPETLYMRTLNNYGWAPPLGVMIWDMYGETRTNRNVINTYNTAGTKLQIDLNNAPGANSYVLLMTEWLTAVA